MFKHYKYNFFLSKGGHAMANAKYQKRAYTPPTSGTARTKKAGKITSLSTELNPAGTSISKAVAFDDNNPYIKSTKSHNGIRTIPIPPDLARYLKEYIKTIKGAQLFRKLDGGMMTKSAYVKMWNNIRRKLKTAYMASEVQETGEVKDVIN